MYWALIYCVIFYVVSYPHVCVCIKSACMSVFEKLCQSDLNNTVVIKNCQTPQCASAGFIASIWEWHSALLAGHVDIMELGVGMFHYMWPLISATPFHWQRPAPSVNELEDVGWIAGKVGQGHQCMRGDVGLPTWAESCVWCVGLALMALWAFWGCVYLVALYVDFQWTSEGQSTFLIDLRK